MQKGGGRERSRRGIKRGKGEEMNRREGRGKEVKKEQREGRVEGKCAGAS